ncbi:hypothetical protein DFH06DRAFT_1164449 [Mycena polygramma]|nr:hypothetical protein DFH06DRAFT_1164449 [Mycena polygramma]
MRRVVSSLEPADFTLVFLTIVYASEIAGLVVDFSVLSGPSANITNAAIYLSSATGRVAEARSYKRGLRRVASDEGKCEGS